MVVNVSGYKISIAFWDQCTKISNNTYKKYQTLNLNPSLSLIPDNQLYLVLTQVVKFDEATHVKPCSTVQLNCH